MMIVPVVCIATSEARTCGVRLDPVTGSPGEIPRQAASPLVSRPVITTGCETVRRPHDEEIVGYLMADGPLAVPVTLAGQPLGPAQDANAATALLVGHGLAALARRWWCRLPEPLARGVLAAGHPLPGWGWRAVVLVEVSPTGCRVRPEWPAPGELTGQAVLPVPVGQLLLAEPPD